MMRTTLLVAAGVALLGLMCGCLAFHQPGGQLPGRDDPDTPAVIATIVPHATSPTDDPYPLFVGAQWVFRNAASESRAISHPSSLLSRQVLATIYCVDEASHTAWECFVMDDIEDPDRTVRRYVHRTTDGLLVFHPRLRDPERSFPGHIYVSFPFQQKTYWAYSVPSAPDTGDILWDQAHRCGGDTARMLGEGECELGNNVALLSITHPKEMVVLSYSLTSRRGTVAPIFTSAWKVETYDGTRLFPQYFWWDQTPSYAWFVPNIGMVKQVIGSTVFELRRTTSEEEVHRLTVRTARNPRVSRGDLVVVELRGTNPGSPGAETWVLAEHASLEEGEDPDMLLLPDGELSFYSDIRASDGSPLGTGTYVFRFVAGDPGRTMLRFERIGGEENAPREVSYFVHVLER